MIKNQGISAYDPRVIEVTGISMMLTAQGADHTTGNVAKYESLDKDVDELVSTSLETQVVCATADSLGLCVFGRSVTNTNVEMIVDLINKATGSELEPNFFFKLGQETLRLEAQFNKEAGFLVEDDDLPQFFYDEPLAPSEQVARFKAQEVNDAASKWWKSQGY